MQTNLCLNCYPPIAYNELQLALHSLGIKDEQKATVGEIHHIIGTQKFLEVLEQICEQNSKDTETVREKLASERELFKPAPASVTSRLSSCGRSLASMAGCAWLAGQAAVSTSAETCTATFNGNLPTDACKAVLEATAKTNGTIGTQVLEYAAYTANNTLATAENITNPILAACNLSIATLGTGGTIAAAIGAGLLCALVGGATIGICCHCKNKKLHEELYTLKRKNLNEEFSPIYRGSPT